jgi:hypothetical protein
MSILDEILAWGGRPAGLAARRDWPPRFEKGIERAGRPGFLRHAQSTHGLPDAESRVAKTLDAAHIKAPGNSAQPVQLLSASSLRNVNALASDQIRRFEPAGMTVIYGDNGSGKSGYSRALKRACWARDQSEAILPDARKPLEAAGKAEAEFHVMVAQQTAYTVKWVDDQVVCHFHLRLALRPRLCR